MSYGSRDARRDSGGEPVTGYALAANTIPAPLAFAPGP